MELVILGGIVIGLGLIGALAKTGMAYMRSIHAQTGYNPLGFINGVMIGGVFVLPLLGGELVSKDNPLGYPVAALSIACVVGLVMRNRVLGDVKRIILVTFFQLFAPIIVLIGKAFVKAGGFTGNAVMQANLNGANLGGAVHNAVTRPKKTINEGHYSKAQDALAMQYGYRDAQDASDHGLEMKKYL